MSIHTSPPILLSSCAEANTATEAGYRISTPLAPSRGARVIALDPGAAVVASQAAAEPWANARFFECDVVAGRLRLRGIGGTPADLDEQLSQADVVVMIATQDSGAVSAHEIGRACWERGIMTAGVVVGNGYAVNDAVAALRPHARVLLPSADESDVAELLSALRA